MNSILNPEAPEFYPHLTTITQSGYIKVNKSIKASNHLPIGASHDLFKTFTDFNKVTSKFSDNVVVESNQIVSTELPTIKLKSDDSDYNTDKIVDANDSLLDRININIDTVSGVNQPSDSIFVKDKNGVNVSSWNNAPVIAKIQMGSTTFIGAKNIPRPQLTFKDTTDNSESLWVPKISDKPNNIKPLALNMIYSDEGEAIGFEHPYRVELDLYHPSVELLEAESEPVAFPQPLEVTPLTFVETEAQVDALVAHLCSVREMAVDVEHHSYRTYQGITCLIQITTDTGGDFIIDTLAAREHIHKLNLAFTDPKKVKVFHGAERDVVWLQRDFGVYLVGLFDTHQAARVLNLNGLSLKYLLMKYCGVDADKKYQLADWRIRPLPEELVAYARSDTHYLLFVWRRLKAELLALAAGQPRLLLAVFERSRQIAAITYNKDVVHDESHMPLYLRSKKSFNSQQMAALKMLYKWRDSQARTLDESTTYLIPNHMVLALAEALPRELQGVAACCQPTPPFVKQHLVTIHRMLLSCRDLPTEPQLYQMPASINEVLNATQHLKSYKVHDLSQIMQDGGDRPINLEQAAGLIEQFRQFNPDIAAFVPLHATCESAVTTNKVSRLNVDAKLFIPPYDRYRKYRALAQIEELKEFKDKEAKIAAIGQGDELIKAEVLQKLQAAKAHLETANKQMNGAAPPPPPAPAPAPAPPPPEEKLSKRKRKMAAKLERKESAPLITDSSEPTSTKLNEAKHKLDNSRQKVKPFQYKNVDYKKFYDETEKGHKQSKKFKKRKHF